MIETFNYKNSLCLIRTGTYYYIGYIDLPQSEWTIDQYNEWQRKSTPNMISLNDCFTPQLMSHYDIKIELVLDKVIDDSIAEFKITEDETYYLVGELFSFKDLLMQLYAVEDKKPHKYWSAMYHYINDKYKAIAAKREATS